MRRILDSFKFVQINICIDVTGKLTANLELNNSTKHHHLKYGGQEPTISP